MQPTLSICIPTFERAAHLERCLTRLEAVTELPFGVEVVVSDNASTDATLQVLEQAQDRLPLRWVAQQQNVGAERNVVSALRQARGRYAVYLADDDHLELDRIIEIVALFEASPSLVCVQAPWRSWDEQEDRDLGPFYQLPGPGAFAAHQAWACWQYLLHHRIFPEIAVYRTEALLPVLHLPRSVHWAFVWCFRLLAKGTVAFQPTPFYRHVVRSSSDLPARTQLGVQQCTTHLDRYRGGLELGLATALRGSVGHVPVEHRTRAMTMLDRFMAERAAVAARVAAGDRDFIAAVEHFTRSVVWQAGVNAEPLQTFEQQHTMLAGLQALIESARCTAGVGRIVLADIPNVPTVRTLLVDVFGWTQPIEADPVVQPFTDAMILVPNAAVRGAWVEDGNDPGRVLVWEELADCYRVHNTLDAMRRTAAA